MSTSLAYVISQFPETHETFILRELVALDEMGVRPLVLSLKRSRDTVVHPRALPFLSRTVYAGRLVRRMGGAALARLAARPQAARIVAETIARWAKNGRRGRIEHAAAAALGVAAAEMCRRRGIRHLHCHWATVPASVGYFASLAGPVTFSISAHAWDIYAGDGLLAEKAKRAAFITTCTEYNGRHLRTLVGDASRVFVNYHGLLDFPPVETGRRRDDVLLAVGRLVETKGFEHLITAFARLARRHVDMRLRIIGSGPLGHRLHRTVEETGVGERVDFCGTLSRRQVAREMARARLLAVPSVVAPDGDRDGLPNVILEAGALGLAVVASRLSGIPEAVVHERTGLLVEPGDVVGLAEAIERLLSDDDLARRLADGMRQLVRWRFDARVNAGRLARLLNEAGR